MKLLSKYPLLLGCRLLPDYERFCWSAGTIVRKNHSEDKATDMSIHGIEHLLRGMNSQVLHIWKVRHTCASWWHLTRTTTSLSGTKVLERWRISQTILLLSLNLTGSKSRWRQLNHVFAQPSHHAVQHLSLLWPVHRVHAALLLPSPVVFR